MILIPRISIIIWWNFIYRKKHKAKQMNFPHIIPIHFLHNQFRIIIIILFCFSMLHLFRAFLHPLLLLKIFHKNLVNKSVIETWNFGKSQNNFIVRTSSGCFCFVYLFVLFPHILSLSPNSPSLFLFPHILSLFFSLHILSLSLASHPSILAKVLQ